MTLETETLGFFIGVMSILIAGVPVLLGGLTWYVRQLNKNATQELKDHFDAKFDGVEASIDSRIDEITRTQIEGAVAVHDLEKRVGRVEGFTFRPT